MSGTILIIDDDQRLCEEMKEVLAAEGYHAHWCCNGEEGLVYLEKGNFDLLLLDLKLPGLSGMEILERAKTRNPALRVIVLTGSPLHSIGQGVAAYEDEGNAPLDLADTVLNKPFRINALLSCIRETIRT
ncbi:MAG: response regulator [bacterium]